jgi:regulator of sigma E protease
VLAVVIYIGIGMVIGLPDGTDTNQVAQVISGGVAEKAGLKAGDRLMAINDERTSDSKRLRERIYSSPSKPVVLTVERDGRLIRLSAVPKPTQVPDDKKSSGTKTVGTIGFYFQPVLKRVGPFTAVWAGTRHAWLTTKDMVLTLADMVRGRAEGGLGGPVAVMRVTGETAQSQGAHGVFLLAAMLSLNIGLLNLLPLPALDGGWIFFLIFEALRGRKLNPAKQAMVQYVGLVVILILMLMVTFKDISNWVMGQGPR